MFGTFGAIGGTFGRKRGDLMGTRDLLDDLTAAGFSITAVGDHLVIRPASKLTDPMRVALREAKPESDIDHFVRDLLQDGVPMPSKGIKAAAREVNYSWRTVHRAAKRIGVKIKKGGMDSGWYWSLPKMPRAEDATEGAEDATRWGLACSAPSAQSVAPSDESEVI